MKINLSKMILKRLKGRLPGQEAVRQNLKLLNAGTDGFKEEEIYYREKISLLLRVFAAGAAMAFLAGIAAFLNGNLVNGYFLPRQKNAYQQELRVTSEEGDTQEITILVEPQMLSEEESRELLAQRIDRKSVV